MQRAHPKLRNLFVTTRACTFYQLTLENQKKVGLRDAHLVLGDVYNYEKLFEHFQNKQPSFKDFINFGDYGVYLSTIDPNSRRTRTIKKEDCIDIQAKSTISHEEFMKIARIVDPEYLVSMIAQKREARTELEKSGRNVDLRIVEKSIVFLKKTIEDIKQSPFSQILAPISGSQHADIRKLAMEKVLEVKDSISGVVVFDLSLEESDREAYHEVVSKFGELGDSQLKVLSSEGNPLHILKGILSGFNAFETNYSTRLAEEGKSINFSPKNWVTKFLEYDEQNKGELESDFSLLQKKDWSKFQLPELDLHQKQLMEDHGDLLDEFTPKCVKGYSKAYLCHLFSSKEMTGNVLLAMHNASLLEEFKEVLNGTVFQEQGVQMADYFLRFICSDKKQEVVKIDMEEEVETVTTVQ